MITEQIILYECHKYIDSEFDMFERGNNYPIRTMDYDKKCDEFDIIKDIINMFDFLPTPDISELKEWLISVRDFKSQDSFCLVTIPPETDAIDYEKVFCLVYSKPAYIDDDPSEQLSLFE